MSWHSTAVYYRLINQEIQRRLGGLHSASILIESVEFNAVDALQRAGCWDELGAALGARAAALEKAGADCLVICSNTTHRLASDIAKSLTIPLLNIVDVTSDALHDRKARRVVLLATDYTLASHVYQDSLAGHGIAMMETDAATRRWVHALIYDELCQGRFQSESRDRLIRIIEKLRADGADAVILGCTELGLLVGDQAQRLAAVDTTEIHALAAAEFALGATPRK